MKQKYDNFFKDISTWNGLVIGDIIIDEYFFVEPKGRAIKDPILSVDYLYSKRYAGGSLAMANNLSNLIQSVDLISVVGDYNREEKFLKEQLNKNIQLHTVEKKNAYTTIKRRYVDHTRNNKLFKIEYLSEEQLQKKETEKVINLIKQEIGRNNIIFVGDFGHGFINKKIISFLEQYSNKLCINVQTNSSNMGFNYITKFNKSNFASMDRRELQLATHNRTKTDDELLKELYNKKKFKNILLTLGKQGCKYINSNGIISDTAKTKSVVDAVGAGDATYIIAGLATQYGLPTNNTIQLANYVGAIAVKIMGNEKSISKKEIYNKLNGII